MIRGNISISCFIMNSNASIEDATSRGTAVLEFTKEQQHQHQSWNCDVRRVNNFTICLMILLAGISILWSVAIQVLSGDFYLGFIGGTFAFHERDFSQIENRRKEMFYRDLNRIINHTYKHANHIVSEMLVMPKEEESIKDLMLSKITQIPESDTTTKVPDDMLLSKLPTLVDFNLEKDRHFLTHMSIDIHRSRWQTNITIQFIYGYPYLSETIAIIWMMMCLIFQSGVKKHWTLPKPWRIVIPSIVVFALMSLTNLGYLILAEIMLKSFCHDLRKNLNKPDAVSCGDAITALRPVLRYHGLTHTMYLNLYRFSYIGAFVLWMCALFTMILRFVLAIDFKLLNMDRSCRYYLQQELPIEHKLEEELLNSTTTCVNKLQKSHKTESQKSEDDFVSAKSYISEISSPLLNDKVTGDIVI